MSISQEKKEELRDLSKKNLFFLARAILGYDEMAPDLHLPICKYLTAPGRYKLLCMPRGFFKTTIATVSDSIRNSLREPGSSTLICCQKAGNAQKMVNEIRHHWNNNPILRSLFPELIPTGNANWSSEKAALSTNEQPECTYESAGIGTQLQSRHYDHIKADDLVVAQKDQTTGAWMKPSEEDIQKAIGWHQMARGIMKDISKTTYTQIMTRWCPDDLYDYLLENEPDRWKELTLSAEDEEGKPTFPGKFPAEELRKAKEDMGPYKYATQYLSDPIVNEKCIFAKTYHLYTPQDIPTDFKRIVASCDPAISTKKRAHYTAIPVVGMKEDGSRYVLEMFCVKGVRTSEIIDKLISLWRRWHFKELGLETIAFQEALEQQLEDRFKAEGGRLFRVKTFTPGSKERKDLRIEGLEPSFRNGWWYIPARDRFLQTQLDEYPYGVYDDALDALAYANRLLPKHQGKNPVVPTGTPEVRQSVTYDELMKELEGVGKGQSVFDVQDSYQPPPPVDKKTVSP